MTSSRLISRGTADYGEAAVHFIGNTTTLMRCHLAHGETYTFKPGASRQQ
ncbi:MBL fold metallo-hydrolase [Mycobacterium ahvazicum]|uniref:MBL fold metallo-hydrolase n=1 Tax=Mycobacterium ahvazicum TaxID=1964395 RepID=A0A2K4Y941_9MYCO|nr:MBL fold metallo-hydrolase [Mycobacterium ahvazicum]